MDMKYGYFDPDQFESFRKKLHSELHWILIYKDPELADEYAHVDFDKYFDGVMRRINGLSSLLFYPPEIIGIMANLEAAHLECSKESFDYHAFRKLVLDAHALVDKIKV